MNFNEKELHGYINGAERMSGADGFDDADGMDYFDDDGGSVDNDGLSYATGNSGNMPLSDPYVIQYQNTTTADVTAILFGYNDNFGATNYGNNAAAVISNLQGGTYGRLLAQSNNKFFKIGKWRFQSTTASQLTQTLSVYHVDGNGKQYSIPMNLAVARDAYQQQSDILDVQKVVTIDGNTYITFTLKGSAVLVISMYPISVLSGKAKLNGMNEVNNARAPRLSGKNVAPIIIQTTQDVRGITKS